AYGDSTQKPYIAVDGQVPSPFVPGTTNQKNPETVGLQGGINLRNTQYWEIANLSISNDDDFATDITTQSVVRDGVNVSINADLIPAGDDTVMDYFRISNLDIHDIDGPSSWQRIHYGGINFQIFGSKQYGEYPAGSNYFRDVRIENNTFTKVELHAVQFGFNWFGDALGQVDETGKWHEGWEQLWIRDRDLYSRDVYIGHNYASDTGQGAFQFAGTKDLVAEYNEVNGFLRRYNQVSAGFYLWAGADSVMRFNEVYDGPANEYDATPWDLEFTNFDVTYEYNYSHDNLGGWMSYMGNSGNSIARYNLSVNDNGVIVKNMLSTNYSPSYFLNNVFVYDGSKLHQFHDEVFKSRVYFANNVFYNTSTTTPTTWSRKPGALDNAVFANNAMFEAGGVPSPLEPADDGKVTADPQFVEPVEGYLKRAGVENILTSAARFQVEDTSPLIDAGRYNERVGTKDFFGTDVYYGAAPDIGIQEKPLGGKVDNPVDTDPIENEGIDTRTNLALNKPVVASTSHPAPSLTASRLTDGLDDTRWASADDAAAPVTIDIDFGAETRFDEVALGEFLDSGTSPRVAAFDLQRWDAGTSEWTTFTSVSDGIGSRKTVKDFGEITSSKLRVLITSTLPGQPTNPTMTEIRVFANSMPEARNPEVSPAQSTFDKAAAAAGLPNNSIRLSIARDSDEVTALRYVSTSGALVGSLDEGEDYTVVSAEGDDLVLELTPAFLASRQVGDSGIRFDFASGVSRTIAFVVVDSTELEAALTTAKAVPAQQSPEYTALVAAIAKAQTALDAINRTVPGTGNASVTVQGVAAVSAELKAATAAVPAAPVGDVLVSTSKPVIDGVTEVGSTLRVQPGGWNKSVRLKYQWFRDGKAISGATGKSIKLVTSDAGNSFTVRTTASKRGYKDVAVTSEAFSVPKVATSVAFDVNRLVEASKAAKFTVKVGAGKAVVTGTVEIWEGDKKLSSTTLKGTEKGVVKSTLPKLSRGLHWVTAKYSGTDDIQGSTSGVVPIIVW
ncbi:MAG: Ig-like domain repeat protein, partial [Rhodococcus fascians]